MDPQIELIGASPGMAAVREKIDRLLPRHSGVRRLAPVLLQGETGTGKGLIARLIHRTGPRRDGPFIDVNCAAIPENLLEAEMFGFERGAFTDARQAKPGLFQVAHGGTIFLDEVGLLPEALQAKLLKVIEERAVRRLGSTRSEQVDVGIIAATNEDLALATRVRRFREDLYHRLAVVTLALPPLRERGQDVLLLAEHFLERACADYGLSQRALTPDARAALLAYPWPGNIRELSNVIERVALLSDAPLVTAETLGLQAALPSATPTPARASRAPSRAATPEGDERERLLVALRETDWNVSRAAARLGISRNTIRYRIEKYRLRPGVDAAPAPPVAAEPLVTVPPRAPRVEVAASPVVRWERRRITFLRVAMVMPEPVALPPDLSRVFEVLVDKAQSFGGHIEELSRAAIVAVFGLDPSEDAPRRAANAAMAIAKGVERARRAEGASPWQLKIAVHVVEVLVGRVNGGTQIDHEAKRDLWPTLDDLIARAAADTIVVSDTAAPFLERHFDLVPLGEPSAALYRLTGRERTGLGPGGRMAQFVGRRHELELLWSRFEAAARGQGQVVGISGEAGIGKSRLLFEFQRSLGDRPVTYLEAHCVSYGGSIPYLPVLELLRDATDIAESDTPEVVAEKVRVHVTEVGMTAEASVPCLLHLLGIKEGTERLAGEDPEALKARIFDVLRQVSLRMGRLRPLILVLEDLHWVDRTSEEYLASLVDGMAGTRVLLIASYRPGYRPPWIGKSYVTQIALQALQADDGLSLVRFVLGTDRVPDALAQLILSKGEGNPFFLEELARTVREQGWESLSTLAVPDTINEVILARIDRLQPDDKRVLQAAAVVGKDVSFEVLQAVSDLSADELRQKLARLHAAEFLYEAGIGPELEYTFRHALTHEVAYESLLPEQRRALHARIVDAIERLHEARRSEYVERLAEHAFHAELWGKAVGYLRDAGAKAAARSAHGEAVTRFEQALTALGHLPAGRAVTETAIDLRFDLRNSLHPLGEHERILGHLREAKLLAEEIQEARRLGWVFSYLTQYSRLMGDPDAAVEAGQRSLAIAGELNDFALRIATNTHLGPVHRMLGDYRGAIAILRETVASLTGDRARERYGLAGLPSVISRNNLLLCHAELGEFAQGAALGEEAIGIAEAADHPYSIISAYAAVGSFALLRGDVSEAIARLERGVELCRHWNIPVWLSVVASSLGAAYACVGRLAEAIQLLEQAVDEAGAARMMGYSMSVVWVGQAYLWAGRVEQASTSAERALELARRQRERGHEAHALRLLGEIASGGAPPAMERAERSYREALSLAEKLGMRPLMAHCELGLGALYRRAGRPGAETHLDAAAALYRGVGMPSWLSRATQERG